jgi:hypothetical protein
MSSISKWFSGKNILIGLVIIFVVGIIYYYSSSKGTVYDGLTSNMNMSHVGITSSGEPSVLNSSAQHVPPHSSAGASGSSTSGYASNPMGNSAAYSAPSVANPSELLPKDANSAWSNFNPSANTNQVIIPDLLEAGYHIGLDTIGQTMKNPNLQERSEPIIPKQNVSPWNNSSFEPDIARVPLEIGYGCN